MAKRLFGSIKAIQVPFIWDDRKIAIFILLFLSVYLYSRYAAYRVVRTSRTGLDFRISTIKRGLAIGRIRPKLINCFGEGWQQKRILAYYELKGRLRKEAAAWPEEHRSALAGAAVRSVYAGRGNQAMLKPDGGLVSGWLSEGGAETIARVSSYGSGGVERKLVCLGIDERRRVDCYRELTIYGMLPFTGKAENWGVICSVCPTLKRVVDEEKLDPVKILQQLAKEESPEADAEKREEPRRASDDDEDTEYITIDEEPLLDAADEEEIDEIVLIEEMKTK